MTCFASFGTSCPSSPSGFELCFAKQIVQRNVDRMDGPAFCERHVAQSASGITSMLANQITERVAPCSTKARITNHSACRTWVVTAAKAVPSRLTVAATGDALRAGWKTASGGRRFSDARKPDQPLGPERQGFGGRRCQPAKTGNLPASPDVTDGPFFPWVAVEARC